jgi:hypothetical protein
LLPSTDMAFLSKDNPDHPGKRVFFDFLKVSPIMTEHQLLNIFKQLSQGQMILGTVSGKSYRFKGVRKYSGRGKFHSLKGAVAIILESKQRKRPILLFMEPLLLFVNSDPRDISFGRLPIKYIEEYRNDKAPKIPNLYEYESHYKSLARYIQGLSEGSELTEKGSTN